MKIFCAVTAFCLIGGAALAGGPVETAAEPGPTAAATAKSGQDWTGFYLGIGKTDGTISDGNDWDTSGAGLQAGYLRDLGWFVIGGELAYAEGDIAPPEWGVVWDATRLKLIGGYDSGRLLPYAFIGLTDYDVLTFAPFSDTMTNFGIGVRYGLGASGKLLLGLEYLVESKANYSNTGFDLENRDLSLRFDYRF